MPSARLSSRFENSLRALVLLAVLTLGLGGLAAQVVIPNYWDPRQRMDRPTLTGIGTVRFLTAPDHPPFNFLNAQGELTGFNVELVRAACTELAIACSIQARSFDTLVPALREGRADVIVAGIAPNADIRRDFDVGDIYLKSPARFATRRDSPLTSTDPERLQGKRIGVLANSAHAAFLDAFYQDAELRRFPDAMAARQALKAGEIDALFADAVSLAFWINGTSSESCCEFRGGAYTESRFFGEGFALVFRPGTQLPRAFDYALKRLAETGTYAELYLRWFPIGLY